MSYDWACLQADIDGVQKPSRHILYTVTGFGADCWSTYPADLARAIGPDILPGLDENWYWRPIAYGSNGLGGVPNWIPAAFPMQNSIDNGVKNMTDIMLSYPPTQTWGFVAYSEGSIVTGDIMDLCGITDSGAIDPRLAPYAESFVGGVTFGGPRREKGHTCPGGIDPGGHGIVRPQLKNTPEKVWDFAAGNNQPGSSGIDLYTCSGYRGDQWTEDEENAVWEIVRTGTLSGTKPLIQQLVKILEDPAHGVPSTAMAIFDALDFFVLHGLQPHGQYHLIRPIPDDPRTCWDLARDYLVWMGENIPARN